MHTMPQESSSIFKKKQAVKTVEVGTSVVGYLFATLACKHSTI